MAPTASSASDVRQRFFAQSLNAITNGAHTAPCFLKVHIVNNQQLLAYSAQLRRGEGAEFDAEVATLHEAMSEANPEAPGGVRWPNDAVKGTKYLRAIIAAARDLAAPEAAAIAASTAAASTATANQVNGAAAPADPNAAPKETAAQLSAKGAELYGVASKVHKGLVPEDATEHVKYELVGKWHSAIKTQKAMVTALGDFALELRVSRSRPDVYEAFGKAWQPVDATDSTIKIENETTLLSMMERRANTVVVASAFDYPGHLASLGKPAPEPPQALADGAVAYVDAGQVAQMTPYATPRGTQVEIDAMRAFRKQAPHIPISKVVSCIDEPLQLKIANLRNKGYTYDAAVYHVCVKCPENYSVAKCEGPAATAATAEAAAATAGGDANPSTEPKGKGKRGRSEDEQKAVYEKRLAQQEQQIQNLKAGKGGKGGGKGGGGYGGGGFGGGGWYGGGGFGNGGFGGAGGGFSGGGFGGGGFNGGGFNGGGKGNGPPPGRAPGPVCPPDVCKDFNFKAVGCTRGAACGLKHICAQCGSTQHCYRGNH